MDTEPIRRIVIVDDDAAFARTLARSFERRGYEVRSANNLAGLTDLLRTWQPDHAVVDLKLGTDSGLVCIQMLGQIVPKPKVIVLTGYASIATAVEAIKLGATHYLPKPANTDDIEAAFAKAEGDAGAPISGHATSIKTWEWERINEVLAETGFNISETARRLGMHRRTLARKLGKKHIP